MVTVNAALVAPAGTVTEGGTVRTVVSVLDRVTTVSVSTADDQRHRALGGRAADHGAG